MYEGKTIAELKELAERMVPDPLEEAYALTRYQGLVLVERSLRNTWPVGTVSPEDETSY
jgi:hypothetical protein